MFMLGFLASADANPAIASTWKNGDTIVSLAGGVAQFGRQTLGIIVAAGLGAVMTFILLKIIDATIGLRVPREAEYAGLDLTEHGESAYNN
jgi:Amt family ammonium transporter